MRDDPAAGVMTWLDPSAGSVTTVGFTCELSRTWWVRMWSDELGWSAFADHAYEMVMVTVSR